MTRLAEATPTREPPAFTTASGVRSTGNTAEGISIRSVDAPSVALQLWTRMLPLPGPSSL